MSDSASITEGTASRPTSGASFSASRPNSGASSYRAPAHHKKHRSKFYNAICKLTLVPKAFCSISFIVLLLATCAAVIPAIIIWTASVSGGLSELQNSFLQESMERRAGDVKLNLELNLGRCETQLEGYAEYMTSLVSGRTEDEADLAFIMNRTMSCAALLTSHHGCGRALVVTVNDGAFGIIEDTEYGAIIGIQQGFPPSTTTTKVYLYNMAQFIPYWTFSFVVNTALVPQQAGLSDTVWEELEDGNLEWTPFESKSAYSKVTMTSDLLAPIKDSTGSFIRGVVALMITDSGFRGLFANQTVGAGMVCIFVQDMSQCLLASTCEEAVLYPGTDNQTRKCTNNSTRQEVQQSRIVFQEHLVNNLELLENGTTIVYKSGSNAFAFALIKTTFGFTAISTVVADLNYFTSTYDQAKEGTTEWVIIGIVIAGLLASLVALITLLGQLQLYRRIKDIIDHSLGRDNPEQLSASPKVLPVAEDKTDVENSEIEPVKPPLVIRILQAIKSWPVFGKFSEIAVILHQLDWLEGKVKIVCAFVPVVAKLVCRHGVSDEKVLDSKLARRMGCYMFCDIAGY